MNEIFAINLINAVVGKKVNVELDKDFLNLLDLSFSERMKGMERTVLRIRFGQDRIVGTPSIASQLGISKDRAKELIDSGIKSKIEIHIITPDAKEQALDIIKSLFLILIKIGIIPINVDIPANDVRIKGYSIIIT